MGDVAMLLFKTGVLNPILHIRVDNHKCTGVKELFFFKKREMYSAGMKVIPLPKAMHHYKCNHLLE